MGSRNALAAALAFMVCTVSSLGAEPLKLGHSTWVGYGALYIAKEKGLFEAEGLEVDLVNIENLEGDLTSVAALAAGKVDVVLTTVDSVLCHLSDQQGFRYLFAVDDSKGGDGIVANKDIQNIAALEGKRVGYVKDSVSQFYLGVSWKPA